MRSALKSMKKDIRERKSRIISEKARHAPCWNNADTILVFLSMQEEVETGFIIQAGLNAGKTVGVPSISGREIIFHEIGCIDPECVINRYGIREPDPEYPVIDSGARQRNRILVFTPGLAFDRNLSRLGRGSGFYDRFIRRIRVSKQDNVSFCGICFTEQLIEEVPVSCYDEKVDAVITDSDVFGIV